MWRQASLPDREGGILPPAGVWTFCGRDFLGKLVPTLKMAGGQPFVAGATKGGQITREGKAIHPAGVMPDDFQGGSPRRQA